MKNTTTRLQKLLEITAWLIILASFGIAIYGMMTLPDTIATHFDASGEADGYGSPGTLLVIPIIMALTLGLTSLISHMVSYENWNIPFKVRENNKDKVYEVMGNMIYVVEFEIAVFTLYVQVKSYREDGEGVLLAVGIFILALMVTIVGLSIRASQCNNRLS